MTAYHRRLALGNDLVRHRWGESAVYMVDHQWVRLVTMHWPEITDDQWDQALATVSKYKRLYAPSWWSAPVLCALGKVCGGWVERNRADAVRDLRVSLILPDAGFSLPVDLLEKVRNNIGANG